MCNEVLPLHRPKAYVGTTCPPGTVLLHQYPRGDWAPSVSPFPIKLETYLRMANIPYKVSELIGLS